MRYAVLSDIHGNLEALQAVTKALASKQIDRYLCLGDVVGYGANPLECLAAMQQLDAIVVGGNHELGCIGKLEVGWFNDAARSALLWTRDQLSFAELDYLRRLPLTQTEGPFTLVHSNLRRPQRFDYLVDTAQVLETLAVCRTLICLCGHTHVPCVVEYDRTQRRLTRLLTEPKELNEAVYQDDEASWRYLINPGSVGQPRDGDLRASFAVIDTDRKTVAFHRARYDVEAAQQKIRHAGLPPFLADRLAIGR